MLYIARRATEVRRAEDRCRSSVQAALESILCCIRRTENPLTSGFVGQGENPAYVEPVTTDFEFLNEARRRFHGERSASRFFTKMVCGAFPSKNYGWNFPR